MILLFYKVLFVVHITLAYPTHIVNKDYMDDVQCATEKKNPNWFFNQVHNFYVSR